MPHRLLARRLVVVLLLGLTLVHASPSGVIVCSSQNGVRYEFFCGCAHDDLPSPSCGCGGCHEEGKPASPPDCVCHDHEIELLATAGAHLPAPVVAAILPAQQELVTIYPPRAAVRAVVQYTSVPPPLLNTTTVVLLI
jgi:hypothetical protein